MDMNHNRFFSKDDLGRLCWRPSVFKRKTDAEMAEILALVTVKTGTGFIPLKFANSSWLLKDIFDHHIGISTVELSNCGYGFSVGVWPDGANSDVISPEFVGRVSAEILRDPESVQTLNEIRLSYAEVRKKLPKATALVAAGLFAWHPTEYVDFYKMIVPTIQQNIWEGLGWLSGIAAMHFGAAFAIARLFVSDRPGHKINVAEIMCRPNVIHAWAHVAKQASYRDITVIEHSASKQSEARSVVVSPETKTSAQALIDEIVTVNPVGNNKKSHAFNVVLRSNSPELAGTSFYVYVGPQAPEKPPQRRKKVEAKKGGWDWLPGMVPARA